MHTIDPCGDDSRGAPGWFAWWLLVMMAPVVSASLSIVYLLSIVGLHGDLFEVVTLLHHFPEKWHLSQLIQSDFWMMQILRHQMNQFQLRIKIQKILKPGIKLTQSNTV